MAPLPLHSGEGQPETRSLASSSVSSLRSSEAPETLSLLRCSDSWGAVAGGRAGGGRRSAELPPSPRGGPTAQAAGVSHQPQT